MSAIEDSNYYATSYLVVKVRIAFVAFDSDSCFEIACPNHRYFVLDHNNSDLINLLVNGYQFENGSDVDFAHFR